MSHRSSARALPHAEAEEALRGRPTRSRSPYPPIPLALALAVALGACRDSTSPPEADLLQRLDALPGVAVQEIPPHYGYPRQFALDVTQPVSHDDPNGPTFTQRAYLSHAGEDRPMIFGAYGYGATEESGEELASLMQANGLYVTHRYFPGSRPQPAEWRWLDIRQAAADHHRIVTLLKGIYPGIWVSAGASKSGMTALFHRRFWPGDVAATVAYVAPLSFEPEDPRYTLWLAARGTPEGRALIHAFQRRLLENETALLPHFQAWFARNGLALSLPPGPFFESAVGSYEWCFWQRHIFDYDDIPGPEAPFDAWIDHLATTVRLRSVSDVWRDYFKAYAYQQHTQLGGPAVDVSHIQDLLRQQPLDPRVEYDFPPSLPMTWDGGTAMTDVIQWLQTQGERIVLLYGGVDPWTGGAIDVEANPNILKVIQPGADHQVRILDLDASSRTLVMTTLESWLGVTIGAARTRGIPTPPAGPDLAPMMGLPLARAVRARR